MCRGGAQQFRQKWCWDRRVNRGQSRKRRKRRATAASVTSAPLTRFVGCPACGRGGSPAAARVRIGPRGYTTHSTLYRSASRRRGEARPARIYRSVGAGTPRAPRNGYAGAVAGVREDLVEHQCPRSAGSVPRTSRVVMARFSSFEQMAMRTWTLV